MNRVLQINFIISKRLAAVILWMLDRDHTGKDGLAMALEFRPLLIRDERL